MTFIFNLVEYNCFDSQGAGLVLNALNTAVQYQIENSITGVVTYHFSRPYLEEPEKLRFIEFYDSEKVFWEHSMDSRVSKALMITFDTQIRKSFDWWVLYSEDIGTKVRETIATLNGIEVSAIQEHVNMEYKSNSNLEPVLFVGKSTQGQDNLLAFLKQQEGLFSDSALYQLAFQDPARDFHLISLWPSQEDILNSIVQLDLPEMDLYAQIYSGQTHTNLLEQVFKPWHPEFFTEPEAGYCLHPKWYQRKNK
jgi:hypothetical protein